ncbi:stage III sporulation protein AF [Lacrimispora saccharolytica]|nr:stage III sporulation protein AF [Lacrimispora saccharolytica]QRV20084.1 stage III sporulation protein AF [Lacrimispora saccharolytica]
MEELFNWIRNITYYLIFITVVGNLLPDKKYEKYIKLFAGMVLILLVLKPVTGGLRLDDTLAYYFEAISLKKEAGELTGKLSDMEGKRLETMIARYEEAVETDLKSMAETDGFGCRGSTAEIDQDQRSSTFGHVVRVTLVLVPGGPAEEAKDIAVSGSKADPVKKVPDVEEVKITGSEPEKRDMKEQEDVRRLKQEENSRLSGLRRRIAEYYDLEEQDIEIQMEDGKG